MGSVTLQWVQCCESGRLYGRAALPLPICYDSESQPMFGMRVIYGHSHIYLNLGICLGCKIQESDLALFVDVIDVHVYFWCHSLVLIFYHIA